MNKGLFVLGMLFIITTIFWFFTTSVIDFAFIYLLSQLIGALALVGFAYAFIIPMGANIKFGLREVSA